MKRNRVKKLEENISRAKQDNIIVLWEGINKPFKYNDKSYKTKEELKKDYPSIKFDFITIVWEDGKIEIEKQKDKIVTNTLEEFEVDY